MNIDHSITTRIVQSGVTAPVITATATTGHYVDYPYGVEETDDAEHFEAFMALVNHLGWHGTWHCGDAGDGARVWVRQSYSVTVHAPEPITTLDALRG